MIRILASDGMEKGAIAALEQKGCEVVCEFFDPEALKTAVQSFDVLVVRSATKVRVPHIDAACETGRLKLIIRGGVGVDNIDVAYAEEKGITVRNTPRASSDAVASLRSGTCSPSRATSPPPATPCARAAGRRKRTRASS